jgi:hypothetical protein
MKKLTKVMPVLIQMPGCVKVEQTMLNEEDFESVELEQPNAPTMVPLPECSDNEAEGPPLEFAPHSADKSSLQETPPSEPHIVKFGGAAGQPISSDTGPTSDEAYQLKLANSTTQMCIIHLHQNSSGSWQNGQSYMAISVLQLLRTCS